MKNKQKNMHWKKSINRIILGLIIFLAIFIRWRTNFDSKLMPGVNALYYPIQVRSLIEKGYLAFPDFPLLFWIEAMIARLLFLFKLGNLSDCIILASKLFDSVFPTFSAIPVFLLVSEWQSKSSNIKWFALISSAFSVLYFSALAMTSDFQKNAFGIVWVYSFLYFLHRSLKSNEWKNHVFTGVFFILVALTHIGCLGLTLLFLLITATVLLYLKREKKRIILISSVITMVILIATLLILYFFVDSVRIERLFSSIFQFKLFENSLIFLLINKQPIPIAPHDIVNMVLINVFAIIGLVLILHKRDLLQKPKFMLVLGATISSLMMSSMIIGLEWFNRLLMMAYVPATLVISFLITEIYKPIVRNAFCGFIIIFILLSIGMGIFAKRPPSVSEEAYLELNQISHTIDKPNNTLVVARHGLEWWVAWILRTHVAQDKAINPETWEHYDAVLFLEQFAGSSGFGPSGLAGKPFREVIIPPDAELIYEGKYFRLAKVHTPPPFPPPPPF